MTDPGALPLNAAQVHLNLLNIKVEMAPNLDGDKPM